MHEWVNDKGKSVTYRQKSTGPTSKGNRHLEIKLAQMLATRPYSYVFPIIHKVIQIRSWDIVPSTSHLVAV